MKVLILGASGQDGSYLSELLLKEKHDVYGLIRRESNYDLPNIKHIVDKMHLIYGDIQSENHLCSIINDIQPDEIYNLAAQSDVRLSFDIPEETAESTAIGHLKLLEAVRKFSPKSKIYFAATSELFGSAKSPQNESTIMKPNSPYACFPKGTKILIKGRGKNVSIVTDRIEDIHIGDWVLSFDELTKVKEFDKVINVSNRLSEEIFDFSFSNNNKVSCTREHPFYVIGKGWIEASKLIAGDEVIQYKYGGLNQRLNNFRKGKNYEEIYGDRSEDIKCRIRKANSEYRIGKTYEELFGAEESILIKGEKRLSSVGKKRSYRWLLSDETKNRMKGRTPWNKGLTKESNLTVKEMTEKGGMTKRNNIVAHPEIRVRMSDTMKKVWCDPDFIGKQLRARNKCPNSHERAVIDILKEMSLDKEFQYNGGFELGVMLGRKIPDFVNINGQKKVIEYFGRYWHSKPYKDSDVDLVEHYRKLGYGCLIIWEEELGNIDILKEKIKTFVYNPNIEIIKVVEIRRRLSICSVYNIETEKNHNYFAYGILVHNCSKQFAFEISRVYRESYGLFIACGILYNHESPRRGLNFVTRKICQKVVEIHRGKSSSLELGNLDARRDWGEAQDFCRAMILILQQEKPDDFVIGTGEMHSVKEFVKEAFGCVGISDWEKYVKINKDLYRPLETNCLCADYSKAKRILGWEPKVKFKELAHLMMNAEMLK